MSPPRHERTHDGVDVDGTHLRDLPRETGCLYAMTASVSIAACERRDGAWDFTTSAMSHRASRAHVEAPSAPHFAQLEAPPRASREAVVVGHERLDRLAHGGDGSPDRGREASHETLRLVNDQEDRSRRRATSVEGSSAT